MAIVATMRFGSSQTSGCNIDESCLDNTTEFTPNYVTYRAKKPVGIIEPTTNEQYKLYQWGTGNNGTNNNQYINNGSVYTRDGSGLSLSPGNYMNNVIFYDVIPWFNSQAEASKYSLGLDFDNDAWIGGKDVRVSPTSYTSNGGGATHIAKVTGQLKDLSSNLSDILIVSGGGGGGLLIGEDIYEGKDAGGIAGNGNNSANQTTGYAFGQGAMASSDYSRGGGGLYGGYKGGTS